MNDAHYRDGGTGVIPCDSWRLRLLPLRSFAVELEFTESARFRWFHGSALYAFIMALLDYPKSFPLLRPHAPESGRVQYEKGDGYRFGLTILPGGETAAQKIVDALTCIDDLPRKRWDRPMPFRDNVRLVAIRDLQGNRAVSSIDGLRLVTMDELAPAIDRLADAHELVVRFTSPLRIGRSRGTRNGFLGPDHFDAQRLFLQLDHSLRLTAACGAGESLRRMQKLAVDPSWRHRRFCLERIDAAYKRCFDRADGKKTKKYLEGAMGIATLLTPPRLGRAWANHLVLGELLGLGMSMNFGFGRYRIERPPSGHPIHQAGPKQTHFDIITRASTLRRALNDVSDGGKTPGVDGETFDDWLDDSDSLRDLQSSLKTGRYEPSRLLGLLVPKKGGGVRALAIPTVRDRIVQRAVVNTLEESVEQLLEDCSHGYRRGLSRRTAATHIERLRDEGFVHVLDADIEDFFDTVDWNIMMDRLETLLGPDDPIVALLRNWIEADVEFNGRVITRRRGLPQGAVVSPMLANIYLDHFDELMRTSGFRIVRYADDFVVLCRRAGDVERARVSAEAALGELGLELNEEKTRATSFNHGFRYLGYLFCHSVVLDGSANEEKEPMRDTARPWPWRPTRNARPWHEVWPKPRAGNEQSGRTGSFPLVIADPSAHLSSRSGGLTVRRKGGTEHVPWTRIEEVTILGRHTMTTPIFEHAAARGVPVHVIGSAGDLLVTLSPENANRGPRGVPWPRWLRQATILDDPVVRADFAVRIVRARLRNARVALARTHEPAIERRLAHLRTHETALEHAKDLDAIRGIEGRGAYEIHRAMARLLAPDFQFVQRSRRPPRDPVSAMLSYGFTLLHAQIRTALQLEGLLPWIGLYHACRPGHAALASDLQEEFRSLIELIVLRLARTRQIRPMNFVVDGSAVRIEPDAKRVLVDAFYQLMSRELRPERTASPLSYRRLIRRQAGRVAAFIDEGRPYEPWFAR